MIRPAWALVLLLAFSTTLSFASDADFQTGPARLDGEWKLDWNRSDSFETVMKALETPWILRRLAGIARVSLELRATTTPADCDECVESVIITVDTPIASKEVEAVLDGKPRPDKDLRGRPTLDRYRWTSEKGLELIREFKLPSGSQARILETRNLGADPDILLSQMTVWVDGTERASITRTFVRTGE